ncbi:hypothetical protein V8E36_003040 [Tilletia maclaganii]
MTEDTTYPVQLYIYDLSHGMARQLSLAMTGTFFEAIYHTSIVVHGKEHFFGQGIFITPPGRSHHGQPIQVKEMGHTAVDQETWLEMLAELRQKYTASAYHLLDYNCNTFSNEVSELLTGNSIPEKIRSLPQNFLATPLGQLLRPRIDSTFASGGGFLPSAAAAAAVPSPSSSSAQQQQRPKKNRKPSAAALAAAQSEAAAASRVLDGVVAEATAPEASASASVDWAVAGGKDRASGSSRNAVEWTLEKALETFLARQSIFEDPDLVKDVHERLAKMLAPSATQTAADTPPRVPNRILCLGIGNVKSGAVPQLQLGFLLLLRDYLATKLDGFCHVEAYDPVFTDDDRELLQALGVDVLDDNQRGEYAALTEPTLVYMPHVGRSLTERLLRTNWSESGLSNLYLCSNDLDVYVTNLPAKKLGSESPCISRIAPHLRQEEVPQLPEGHPQTMPGALNDLAFQHFDPGAGANTVESSFWELPPVTQFTDPETL